MATIKSILSLEDRMTPALSKAEKQAIRNAEACKDLKEQINAVGDEMRALEEAGLDNTKAFWDLDAIQNKLVNEMQDYADGTKDAKDSQDKLGTSAIELNQTLELLQKAWRVLGQAMQEANKWVEENNKQFNAQFTAAIKMHNVLGATEEEIQSMYDYADALQKVGVVGDEAIVAGMSELTVYTDNMEQLKKLTPAILDLAVAENGLNTTQSNVTSTATMIGRALNGQARSLKMQLGLTDAEIKALDNMNNKAEKAAYLYQLIESKVGGANEMLAQTAQGGIMQANNSMSDMAETLGSKVTPYITQFKQVLVDILTPIVDFIAQNEWLIPVLGGIAAAIGTLIVSLTIYKTVTSLATVATAMFGVATATALLPITILIIAIGALIGVLIYLWNTNDDVAYGMLVAWDAFLIGIKIVFVALKGILWGFLKFFEMWAQIIIAPLNLILWGMQQLGFDVAPIEIDFTSKLGESIQNDLADIGATATNMNATRADRAANRNRIGSGDFDISKAVTGLNEKFDNVLSSDGSALNTTSKDGLLSDEDIQLLLDVATRDYKLNYQQITPDIHVNVDARQAVDVDGILENIVEQIEEVYNGDAEVIVG